MNIPRQLISNVRTMHKKGWGIRDIASMTGLTTKQVKEITKTDMGPQKSPSSLRAVQAQANQAGEPDLLRGAKWALKQPNMTPDKVALIFGEENMP